MRAASRADDLIALHADLLVRLPVRVSVALVLTIAILVVAAWRGKQSAPHAAFADRAPTGIKTHGSPCHTTLGAGRQRRGAEHDVARGKAAQPCDAFDCICSDGAFEARARAPRKTLTQLLFLLSGESTSGRTV
jgi:hypothetical protein